MTCSFFFFNDTATTEIYTLSLHDALPISQRLRRQDGGEDPRGTGPGPGDRAPAAPERGRDAGQRARRVPEGGRDRKSTRLNSSHLVISYAVFCLKKKKTNTTQHRIKWYHG